MKKEQTLFGSYVILDQLLFGAWHIATEQCQINTLCAKGISKK